MGPGAVTEVSAGLSRIVLAEAEDIQAFVLQCGFNRISRACAVSRISKAEELSARLRHARPALVVLSTGFNTIEGVQQVLGIQPGCPVIAVLDPKDGDRGEDLLKAGALDCFYNSELELMTPAMDQILQGASTRSDWAPHFSKKGNGRSRRRSNRNGTDVFSDFPKRAAKLLRQATGKIRYLGHDFRNRIRIAGSGQNSPGSPSSGEPVIALTEAPKEPQVSRRAALSELALQTSQELDELRKQAGSILSAAARDSDGVMIGTQLLIDHPVVPAAPEKEFGFGPFDFSCNILWETSLDPMLLLDSSGTCLKANAAACVLLRKADPIGRHLADFVHPAARTEWERAWNSFLASGTQQLQARLLLSTGEETEIAYSLKANVWFGVHLFIARDITEARQFKRDLQSLKNLLERASLSQPQPPALKPAFPDWTRAEIF